ncbi:aquaporin [Rhizobium sp. SG741]|uniref:aquaporin n=1 Tax=Rhizobium sp. SG741 TaxID=2587114 RepID=UPI0017DD572A|nr:aquaporin [Rhizobium sp. SG741]NKJ03805.1 glycerol uptake facilitator-like aquaporin [Rhizobium sp. SG741]
MESSLLKLVPQRASRCFVEDDASAPLVRRSLAEAVGTMLLIVAVVGAGTGGKAAPISSAMAISGTLIALILALGSVSGGHFNPVITVLQWRAGQRGLKCTTWYVAAQILGGIAGAVLVDVMFAVPPGAPTAELPNVAAIVSERCLHSGS